MRPPLLPAYAHNDYANPRPLYEALELGFRGVEADVLLRGGELRLGHDANQTRQGRTLERVYLAPLRRIVHQCGHVLEAPVTFLLNIELKERSREGFDSLVAALERYRDLVDHPDGGDMPPAEIVLVGWHPPPEEIAPSTLRLFRLQQQVTSGETDDQPEGRAAVRLVSLDYGKTIGWSGRGPLPASASSWLARVRAAKQAGSGRVARAYDIPTDSAVYRLLLEGGVDLLGPKQLRASQAILSTMNYATQEER